MAPQLWSRLPCELIAMVTEERRRRLQKAKFHLYSSEEERQENLARMREEANVEWATWTPSDSFSAGGLFIRHYNRDGVSILGMAVETRNNAIGKYLITYGLVTAADVSAPIAVNPVALRRLVLFHTNSLATLAVHRARDWAVDHFIDLAGPQIVPAIDAQAAVKAYRTLRVPIMARLLSVNLPFIVVDLHTGWTPIHYALGNPDRRMFDLAFQHTPKTALNIFDRFGDSILFHALNRKHYYALDKLLASGLDPDIPNREHVTLLHRACVNVDAQAVRLLIHHGATPRVGSSTTMGTSLNAFANGMWRNRGEFTREDAQAIFDALVGAGARGELVGPDASLEELICFRFSRGYQHERELSHVSFSL